MSYESEYRRSIEQPEAFWAEQAQAIYWHKPPQKILEYANPPFRSWFADGETNLCYCDASVFKSNLPYLD